MNGRMWNPVSSCLMAITIALALVSAPSTGDAWESVGDPGCTEAFNDCANAVTDIKVWGVESCGEGDKEGAQECRQQMVHQYWLDLNACHDEFSTCRSAGSAARAMAALPVDQQTVAFTASMAAPAVPGGVRIMAFNLWQGGRGDYSLAIHTAYIREHNPDIVFFSEIDSGVRRSGSLDQIRNLAWRLAFPYYRFGRNYDHEGGQVGVAVMSRYPLDDFRTYPIPRLAPPNDLEESIHSARVNINGVYHRLYYPHLPHDGRDFWGAFVSRQRQRYAAVDLLTRLIDAEPHPILAGGDFNAVPESPEIRLLTSRLTDAFPEVSGADHCGRRIDYVFFRHPTYRVTGYAAPCLAGQESDHPIPVVDLGGITPEHAECGDLRMRLPRYDDAIEQLYQDKQGLDPRHPIDRAEIGAINAEIARLTQERSVLLGRARGLGCRR